MSQDLHTEDDSKTYVVPELAEFERLLSTIDTQPQPVDNNNNTNNHVTTDLAIDIKTNEEKSTNKEEEGLLNSMQNHVEMLNNQIEKNLSCNERILLLTRLFSDCPVGIGKNISNSYLITNWILKVIKNSFSGGGGGTNKKMFSF